MISFAFEQLLPSPPLVLQACIQKLHILNYHMSEFISLMYTQVNIIFILPFSVSSSGGKSTVGLKKSNVKLAYFLYTSFPGR